MIKNCAALCCLLLVLLLASVPASIKNPPGDILGIQLGMNIEKAHRRLQKIARFDRNERKRQEVWALTDDRRFSHLILGYDESSLVRYVTVVAHKEGGRRVRYSDVVDVKKAHFSGGTGNYEYVWKVGARGGRPSFEVIVRGADSEYLSLYSLKRVDSAPMEREAENRPSVERL